MTAPLVLMVLSAQGMETALRIKAGYPGATIHGLAGRVQGADQTYTNFGEALRERYRSGDTIAALCSAGITIRALASLLENKGGEPPVLAIADDGSAVVPLLGGTTGVNVLARQLAKILDVSPAITTSGELRFGTCLLNPPAEFHLKNPEDGKRFIADLLAGKTVQIDGPAPWLQDARLPVDGNGTMHIRVTPSDIVPQKNELVFHPKVVVIGISGDVRADEVRAALAAENIAIAAVVCLAASVENSGHASLHHLAAELGLPLRFLPTSGTTAGDVVSAFIKAPVGQSGSEKLAVAVAATPDAVTLAGHRRGRLAVIGLGPGDPDFMIPAVRQELQRAEDVLGYETYVRMAGSFRADQVIHMTDNREEMQRARHAFELAASGRSVVMISSGDPGVFAMAAAVVEALHESDNPAWHGVDLQILPGVSAAMAAASRSGAPLGHDFCILSLSDNLKPWDIIEKRIALAAEADFAMAFYNPISKPRPWQLPRAIEILRQHRAPDTPIVLGRDIGRPAETLRVITLAELSPEQVDMRTVILVGSSLTQSFDRMDGGKWVYTPRWYGSKPVS
ncbi:precorrin-3B C(17)-methyltransferase [Phyllobacterium myrsinacearum]|uniref:Cobalt-precorrin 5A hydrolase/precorrin-3B C17-methyltransferase n=1 Tax=Phyllobacterium myrsinacearum TaxID=28101 RepID=A0A839ERE9_9HYPH|nr:precorrin-3B C(17)-methyltransferase [Phyllobacterium myrsinacearum]MBA8881509.1 cobalt-precorrin 5A hydrolase/precorrin-3B C17-methyltransferase [Phyllobacterium myrsinacearum]